MPSGRGNFDVNDMHHTGLTFDLDFETANESDVLQGLIDIEYFSAGVSLEDLEITFEDEDLILIDYKEDGQMLCQLQRKS